MLFRSVSLNYVKADEQSIYQIGEDAAKDTDTSEDTATAADRTKNKKQLIALDTQTITKD